MKAINLNGGKIELKLNIAGFLTEYFGGKSGFSYRSFWQAVNDDTISIYTDRKTKNDSSFYYEYSLLKAEEEMEAEYIITETYHGGAWRYSMHYINAEEPRVSYFFYTKNRIMAFIQHENETLKEVVWEMQEITHQKPILCLESYNDLFCNALSVIAEATYDYYNEEDLQMECCHDKMEVADWMQYKFRGSQEYMLNYCKDDYASGNIVGNAIDAAWTLFYMGV